MFVFLFKPETLFKLYSLCRDLLKASTHSMRPNVCDLNQIHGEGYWSCPWLVQGDCLRCRYLKSVQAKQTLRYEGVPFFDWDLRPCCLDQYADKY